MPSWAAANVQPVPALSQVHISIQTEDLLCNLWSTMLKSFSLISYESAHLGQKLSHFLVSLINIYVLPYRKA